MKSVEAVIRMFDPVFHVAEIAPRRLIAGQNVSAALANLSTAGIERLPGMD